MLTWLSAGRSALLAAALCLVCVWSATAAEGPDWLPLQGTHGRAVGCTWANGCTNPPGYHGYPAIDFTVASGSRVHAAGPGMVKVAHAECANNTLGRTTACGPAGGRGLGNMVRILHPDGRHSWYGHLSTVTVTVGQEVQRGDILGTSGNSGKSYGPHLHYQETSSASYASAVDPGPMAAGRSGKRISYPSALGAQAWGGPGGLPCGRQGDEPTCTGEYTITNDGPRSIRPPTQPAPGPIRLVLDPARQALTIAGRRIPTGAAPYRTSASLRQAFGAWSSCRIHSFGGETYTTWRSGLVAAYQTDIEDRGPRCAPVIDGFISQLRQSRDEAVSAVRVQTEYGSFAIGDPFVTLPAALRRSADVRHRDGLDWYPRSPCAAAPDPEGSSYLLSISLDTGPRRVISGWEINPANFRLDNSCSR